MRGRKHASEEARRAARRASLKRYHATEKRRAALKRYHAKPKVRARMGSHKRAAYAVSSERDKAYVKRWRAANPDGVSDLNRRQRERRAGIVVSDQQAANAYAALVRRDPCSYCGSASCSVDVDHIDSVARGGKGDWDNLTGACPSCNRSKRAKPLLLFLLRRVDSR